VKPVVVADPPPAEPEPAEVITTPVPPEPTVDDPTPTPPDLCRVATAAACPPPRPPVLTCRTCGLVAPVPTPRPPLRLAGPERTP
jgi:hypothetical protein